MHVALHCVCLHLNPQTAMSGSIRNYKAGGGITPSWSLFFFLFFQVTNSCEVNWIHGPGVEARSFWTCVWPGRANSLSMMLLVLTCRSLGRGKVSGKNIFTSILWWTQHFPSSVFHLFTCTFLLSSSHSSFPKHTFLPPPPHTEAAPNFVSFSHSRSPTLGCRCSSFS